MVSSRKNAKFFIILGIFFPEKATLIFEPFEKNCDFVKKYTRLRKAKPSSSAVTLTSKLTSVACKPERKVSLCLHLNGLNFSFINHSGGSQVEQGAVASHTPQPYLQIKSSDIVHSFSVGSMHTSNPGSALR